MPAPAENERRDQGRDQGRKAAHQVADGPRLTAPTAASSCGLLSRDLVGGLGQRDRTDHGRAEGQAEAAQHARGAAGPAGGEHPVRVVPL
jgi:hypothetical protein